MDDMQAMEPANTGELAVLADAKASDALAIALANDSRLNALEDNGALAIALANKSRLDALEDNLAVAGVCLGVCAVFGLGLAYLAK